ncbi:MAG TPA: hypothetical protein VK967_05790 [Methylotenera sp.]|nr:hypothetical protein [Methylotenera sp.]
MMKLFSLITGLLLFSGFATQTQAAPNDDFGRLFSRPDERKNLDYLRQNQPLKTVTPAENLQPEDTLDVAPLELPDPITLQGYVKRSDGTKSTLWINNQAVQEDSTVDNVQIGRLHQRGNKTIGESPDGLDVKIPANGKRIRLKAGQVYEPETNQIKELKTVEKEKQLNLEEAGVIGGNSSTPNTLVNKPEED